MVLMRMPTGVRSRATGRVSPTMPALAEPQPAWPTCPSNAATLAVMTIAPRPPSRSGSLRDIAVAASRTTLNVPTRFSMT